MALLIFIRGNNEMLLTKELTIKENTSKRVYAPIIVFASSFLMYLIAILPILVLRGLPFFYYGDYNVQQIPFYIVAHRAVRSGEFFWNWNIDLGGSMAGDFSFYLWGSPFFFYCRFSVCSRRGCRPRLVRQMEFSQPWSSSITYQSKNMLE